MERDKGYVRVIQFERDEIWWYSMFLPKIKEWMATILKMYMTDDAGNSS